MKQRTIFASALAALVAAPLIIAACDGEDPPSSGACGDPNVLSLPACTVAGGDPFSDEACAVFDDGITRGVTTDPARAPSVTAPAEMQSVPGATPFTFSWSAPTSQKRPWRERFERWGITVREAHAHCLPFSGQGYELSFRVRGAVVLRRQQSATSWTPDAATWGRLRTAAGTSTVELTVVTARFNANQIGAGSGPFASGMVRRFTIAN